MAKTQPLVCAVRPSIFINIGCEDQFSNYLQNIWIPVQTDVLKIDSLSLDYCYRYHMALNAKIYEQRMDAIITDSRERNPSHDSAIIIWKFYFNKIFVNKF